uniref:Uncharacterized protein n=1 Tax=Anguilla anguilla TaxID=7936 RepID=A0A0E9T0D8_ANGAN
MMTQTVPFGMHIHTLIHSDPHTHMHIQYSMSHLARNSE